ncbi:MAG: citrate/2-methylcitrate synthase [Planctomycetota bacterium]|jgi:succinyl-CoA synthetase alpha subunit
MQPIAAHEGLLAHLIRSVRPDLYETVERTGRVETAVIGLGGQGTRHAGLMQKFGTNVAAGVAPGRGGERVQETIPVYDGVAECLEAHPDLAAVSVWRHFSSARDAALEAIEAGVPVIVLITEWIPLRDVRDILAAARARGTLLFGGNTPGVIFPPERIKIGMLPDVFHPAEPAPEQAGARGVTILSRSGAILYHISDALASAGIAQNGVLGVGGDGAIGSTFRELVPLVMGHDETDLVVVAGEIGGAQEEFFAEEVQNHPDRYPKPIVAMISGARAPTGKTMGHAGAIVAPGQEYGTFESKRAALEGAGVTVVNSQYDLIEEVRGALAGRTYFETSLYYERMRETWEAVAEPPSWGTTITLVEPNNLVIAGYPLQEIVPEKTLLETAHLLVRLDLPDEGQLSEISAIAGEAARQPAPAIGGDASEQLSTTLARYFLVDEPAVGGRTDRAVRALGRAVRYLATILGHGEDLDGAAPDESLGSLLNRAVGGAADATPERVKLVEAMAVASVDHGVTPPSAQATILAATVRAPFEMALSSGVGAITDVHGGAGAEAGKFFLACVERSRNEDVPLDEATHASLVESARAGLRISGMGHRVHTEDPRRDVLWEMAARAGTAGPCVEISKMMEDLFEEARGFRLPINVDGVIGAVVADMGLDPIAAKALFILGRVAGLSAHYFEEVLTQPPMRRVRFEEAVYRGPELRGF